MKQAWLVIPLVLIVSMIGIVGMQESFGDAEISLIGEWRGNSFDFTLYNDKTIMSGDIWLSDGSHLTLENLKVISKHNKLFIFDNTNNLKIMLKEFSSTKHLVLVKSNNDIKLRAMVDGTISSNVPNVETEIVQIPPTQRNFFTAYDDMIDEENKLKTENQLFRDKQLVEKQKKIQTAQDIHNEHLDRLQQDDRSTTAGGLTSSEIIENYQTWRDTSSDELNTASSPIRSEPPSATGTTTIQNNNSGVSVFFNVPTHTQWNDSFRYTILVTDDNAHRYENNFGGYVGNQLGNVSVTGKIITPDGQIVTQFQGVTNQNGIYENSWTVPDRILARGEYTIEAHATLLTNGGTSITSGDGTKTFFVIPERSTNNARPVSNAGIDIHDATGELITLDGSASSDIDDSILFYTWALTNGTVPETLINPNTVNPTYTIPDIIDFIYFSLIVDDGRKEAPPDTMIVSSLHSEAGANQTLSVIDGFILDNTENQIDGTPIQLDGTGSWDALGHPITYVWSFLDFPGENEPSLSNSTAPDPTFIVNVVGNYTLNLAVSDDTLTDNGLLTDLDFVGIEIKQESIVE